MSCSPTPRVRFGTIWVTVLCILAPIAAWGQDPSFPHPVHTASLELPCTHCHTGAERTEQAGIPSISRCLGCHDSLSVEHPTLDWLTALREANAPAAWPREHNLPDGVRFSHLAHAEGQVPCARCHGEVTETEPKPAFDLKMVECIGCHREHEAPRDCAVCHSP